jgi:type VI secretion system protein VasD
MYNLVKSFFVIAFFALLTGCAAKTEHNVDFNYNIRAAADINPDIQNMPSPVIVRVYQLSNKINFEDATYNVLFESDHNALGAEYISLNEYLVHPGTNNEVELKISENAKYLGVAVGYRSIDNVNWRTVIAVPDGKFWRDAGIEIKVDKLSVRVLVL